MIKLGKYISELLYRHDSVILPGFGTFSTKYVPARFIPEEKIVESPRKIVDFSPEPREGETPLIAFMAKKEGKSHEEVLQHISETLMEAEHALEAGNKVAFEMVGTFYRETDGNLKFDASRQVNYLDSDTGVQAVDTPPQKPIDTIKEPDPEPETKKSVAVDKDKKPQTNETMKEPVKKETKQDHQPKEKESMDPALKWLAIIGLPTLLILIILFWQFNYFFGDDGLFRKSETVVEAPVEVPAETVEPEPPTIEPEEPPYDPYLKPARPEPGRPVYYIIVGSFRSESNASNLALKLRKEDARLASVLGRTPAEFYRVYYGWYYDLSEAKAEKQKLDEDLREIAWILHR